MKRLTYIFLGVLWCLSSLTIAYRSSEKTIEESRQAFVFVNQQEKCLQIAFKQNDGTFAFLENTPFSHKSTKRFGETRSMQHAYLFKTNDNLWHCIWSFEGAPNKFAHQISEDLIVWKLQNNVDLPNGISFDYPTVKKNDENKYV